VQADGFIKAAYASVQIRYNPHYQDFLVPVQGILGVGFRSIPVKIENI
jgi:hypothetical protein